MSTAEFTLLLTENADFLKPFAINLTKDHETAKDLFQETLYRALSNKDKYNVGTNIKAWLYTIMRNIFINDYRKKAKQSVVLDNSPNDFLIDQTRTKVLNDGVTNLNLREVKQLIYDLPELFRTPFNLYFEGYKYNEIADELYLYPSKYKLKGVLNNSGKS